MTTNLTPYQQAHVAKISPDWQKEMSECLLQSATVVVREHGEDPDAPPFVIVVADTNFWIDCLDSLEAAQAQVTKLGLTLAD